MQTQTNTDRNITGSEALAALAHTIFEGALARFSDRITRGAADKLKRAIESTLGRLRDDEARTDTR